MAEKTVKSRTVFDKNLSGWSKDQPPINPALESDVDADVAVIGGGYTGLSAAYHINNAVDTQAPFTYTQLPKNKAFPQLVKAGELDNRLIFGNFRNTEALEVPLQWLSKKRSVRQTLCSTTTYAAIPYYGTFL